MGQWAGGRTHNMLRLPSLLQPRPCQLAVPPEHGSPLSQLSLRSHCDPPSALNIAMRPCLADPQSSSQESSGGTGGGGGEAGEGMMRGPQSVQS